MPLYQVGDRVHVREDLSEDVIYHMADSDLTDVALYEMVKLAGEVVTIKKNLPKYLIEEDSGWFYWVDEMFEGLADAQDDKHFDFDPDELF